MPLCLRLEPFFLFSSKSIDSLVPISPVLHNFLIFYCKRLRLTPGLTGVKRLNMRFSFSKHMNSIFYAGISFGNI